MSVPSQYVRYKARQRKYNRLWLWPLSCYYKLMTDKRLVMHSVQATSFGGAATTMLYAFFKELNLDIPPGGDYGRWKHMRMPPGFGPMSYLKVRKDFKVVYLLCNPMNAIVSLFRRRYHHWHLERMEVPSQQFDRSLTLEEYLARGKDVYLMNEHFHNWSQCPRNIRDYPIMLLKYEAMWDHLTDLFDFLEIPRSMIGHFPQRKKRHSDWQTQPESIQRQLYDIYGAFHETIEDFPEIRVI